MSNTVIFHNKNKRQFNFLPLVKYLYFIFRITPTIDIEPVTKNHGLYNKKKPDKIGLFCGYIFFAQPLWWEKVDSNHRSQ